jgi:hypothetical protein
VSGCCHARLPWRMAWPRHHRCRTVCNCLRTYDSCARARRGSLARLRHVHASWPGQCRACHSWASDPKMCMAACATVCSSWLAASSVSVRVEPSTLDGTTTLVRSPCRICLQACAMRGGVYHPPHNRQDARLCGWVRQHLLCTNDRRRVLLLPHRWGALQSEGRTHLRRDGGARGRERQRRAERAEKTRPAAGKVDPSDVRHQ